MKLSERLLAGLAFGYSEDKASFGDNGGGFKLNEASLTAYVGYGQGPWYVGATLGAGDLDFRNIHRTFALGGGYPHRNRRHARHQRHGQGARRLLVQHRRELAARPVRAAYLPAEQGLCVVGGRHEQHGDVVRPSKARLAGLQPGLAGKRHIRTRCGRSRE